MDRLYSIEGQPPLLSDLPVGCRFESRCAYAREQCVSEYPQSFSVEGEHTADCWKLDPAW